VRAFISDLNSLRGFAGRANASSLVATKRLEQD
jgi:hypothetical protein